MQDERTISDAEMPDWPLAGTRGDLIDEAFAQSRAAAVGLAIPPACMPGVVANLRLLGQHIALIGEMSER